MSAMIRNMLTPYEILKLVSLSVENPVSYTVTSRTGGIDKKVLDRSVTWRCCQFQAVKCPAAGNHMISLTAQHTHEGNVVPS